jgi:acyl-coenzyme A synthetase/AMP-(fatty) acid ligase
LLITIYYFIIIKIGMFMLVAEEGELKGVRLCVSAGEALPPDILKRWEK